ncbi:S-layer homology domain-containing protein, partial [Arthrobacter sp. H20]|uniref:S-layer homology domain-containing protein n=1 Tax=Arthrobacter sp. H20 TaxID=1267981 RepID=UPI00138AB267
MKTIRAALMMLAVLVIGAGTLVAPAQVSAATTFRDVPSTSQFHTEITWLADQGISKGWSDGTFRPLQSVARDAMAAFLYRLAGSPAYQPPAQSWFTDVPVGIQFYKEIHWLASQGITTGYPDRTFKPLSSVNRDAMAAFLYRFSVKPAFTASETSAFRDVPTSNMFYKEISWLANTGISTGWP